jgi:hypothetical protein
MCFCKYQFGYKNFVLTSKPFTLTLTAVGPFGHTFLYMLNTLKVLKERYCLKLAIPQASSYASFEITILTNSGLIRL